MKDPKKKFLQHVSDISKTGADITQSPSAWQNFKSDLNSVVKYPFQSLRSKIQTGNIPYNLSGAIESGNFKSQPMDTAFDMVNAPGAALNLVQKLTSGKTNNTDKLIAGASILPVGRAFKVAQSLKKNKVFKHFGNTEINEIKNITNITSFKICIFYKPIFIIRKICFTFKSNPFIKSIFSFVNSLSEFFIT